jgi:hypothetical protein
MSSPYNLLDVDLSGLRSLGLGNKDAQDAVLEVGLDIVLVDAGGEGEGAVEFSNRALANPVLRRVLIVLGDVLVLRLLGDLVVGVVGLVLDGGLVTELLLLGRITTLDEALRALTFLTGMLVTTRDGQRVVVGPLDVDVLLLDTRKFSMEFVSLLRFLHIELGSEGTDAVELAVDVAEGLPIVLVEETEDRSEFLSESWEKRHCCWCVGKASSSCNCRLGDAVELPRNSLDGGAQ